MPNPTRKPDSKAQQPGRTKPRRSGNVLLRGLTLLLPPILTIVVLLWVISTVQFYVLEPVKLAAREVLVWTMADVKDAPAGADPVANSVLIDGRPYQRLSSNQYVPSEIVQWLEKNEPSEPLPATGEEVYREYVEARHLQPQVVIPVFLCVFVLLLYVLGKFLGGKIVGLFDWGVLHLPIVRKVYGAVKQVTGFVFGEAVGEGHQLPYRRVVAIEYPRPGLWSVGLVMGDAVLDVSAAANEPCVTVMLPDVAGAIYRQAGHDTAQQDARREYDDRSGVTIRD